MSKLRPIKAGRVAADFFTSGYRLSASAVVYQRRLVDLLDDPSVIYIDLLDVYVSRVNAPGDIIATYTEGIITKADINLILLYNEQESVSKERFYAHQRIKMPVFLTVPSFEVGGVFQWLGQFTYQRLLSTDKQKFLPVLEATVRNTYFPEVAFQAPTVLVNKASVATVCMNRETT